MDREFSDIAIGVMRDGATFRVAVTLIASDNSGTQISLDVTLADELAEALTEAADAARYLIAQLN